MEHHSRRSKIGRVVPFPLIFSAIVVTGGIALASVRSALPAGIPTASQQGKAGQGANSISGDVTSFQGHFSTGEAGAGSAKVITLGLPDKQKIDLGKR